MSNENNSEYNRNFKIKTLGIVTFVIAILVMLAPTLTGVSIVMLAGILVTMGGCCAIDMGISR